MPEFAKNVLSNFLGEVLGVAFIALVGWIWRRQIINYIWRMFSRNNLVMTFGDGQSTTKLSKSTPAGDFDINLNSLQINNKGELVKGLITLHLIIPGEFHFKIGALQTARFDGKEYAKFSYQLKDSLLPGLSSMTNYTDPNNVRISYNWEGSSFRIYYYFQTENGYSPYISEESKDALEKAGAYLTVNLEK